MPVLVATLVVDPAPAPLSDARLDETAQGVARFEPWRWLDEGAAADLAIDAGLSETRAALEDALEGEPIDVIIRPAGGREKPLLVADLDSTLIRQECVGELAAFAGVGGVRG
jgi:phosphoserine phosphatase